MVSVYAKHFVQKQCSQNVTKIFTEAVIYMFVYVDHTYGNTENRLINLNMREH